MRFIVLLFLVIFMGLGRAETHEGGDLDLIDLHLLLKQINQLNQAIIRYQKDPDKHTEVSLYSDQKNELMHTFALKLLNPQEKIGIDIDQNQREQGVLQKALIKSSKNNDIYTYLADTFKLKNLEVEMQMYGFLEKMRTSTDLFSQEKDVKGISTSYLVKLEDFAAKTYTIPKHLDEVKQHELQTALDQYQIRLKTYTDVLRYIQKNPKEVLARNIVFNINMQWVLERIAGAINHIFPNTNGLQNAKILLSLGLLVFLLALRQVVTALFVKALDYCVRFSRKSANINIQAKIRDSILAPISTFLFIYSFDISIDILYYPHPAPAKFDMYLGVIYISLVAWLVIALFKAYGAAILATLASKKNGFRKEVINLILKIAYFFIFVLTILGVLKQIGFNISTIIASLGIGGLAVALAVKDVLANFFASVILLLDNSFNQGDWIVCGDVEGTVVEMGLRRTTIRGFDNALFFVPNSELAGKSIRNWNRRKMGRRIKMIIGVTYDSPRESLQKCVVGIRQMLEQHPYIAKDSDLDGISDHEHHDYIMDRQHIVSFNDLMGYKSNLFVYLDSFGDSSINIFIYCFSKSVVWGEWLAIKEDVILKIMEVVESCGLSFAFPSQSVYIESMPHKD
ncbi:Potassium efflux system protein/Small-conductance mechanosensitive channel [Helicobacter ailurogastricus]|uniref:mechanosensitive ion channel family protein n=1 Tax=Helicobacter ailurogastricus TaxID=1578720 RepID=UPI00244D98ED|nr:mechanosensitive ion channel family protein [Helicobacter ailurogastricus]GMB90639.1 Potassium efflux system protein/Small-conductance mechanosensitive channel [Helicobacter ailurogastricus]